NVLGYYTYPTNNPPTVKPHDSTITIIFPNASKAGFGGNLNAGDRVYLGKFPANTSLGLVLIANGWNGAVVGNGLWKVFANRNFNPEADSSLRKHTVILNDTASDRIVIGFEDVKRDLPSCDQDFNDLIVFLTTKPKTCVNKLDSIPVLTADGKIVFSGKTGGVESYSLGNVLVNRMLQQTKKGEYGNINYSQLTPVKVEKSTNSVNLSGIQNGILGIDAQIKLSSLMPNAMIDSGFTAFNSSPIDITGFTNAKDVAATDYTLNNQCRAVAFITRTNDQPYTHTKAICDRLRNAAILGVESFTYEGINFLRYTINRGSGTIEYATHFTVGSYSNNDSLFVQSQWLTDAVAPYPTQLNFQLWAAAPYLVTDMLIEIVGKLKQLGIVTNVNAAILPEIYFVKGQKLNGKLGLTIKNTQNRLINAAIRFNNKANEQAPIISSVQNLAIAAGTTQQLELNVNDLYESNIQLLADNKTTDLLYLGDGAWTLDFPANVTTIQQFTVTNADTNVHLNNRLAVQRNIQFVGKTSAYISAAKLLNGGGLPIDLSSYQSLQFWAKGGSTLKITFIKNSIANWDKQYAIRIPISNNWKEYGINLNELISANSTDKINATDVTGLVFSFEVPQGSHTTIDGGLKNIYFSKQEKPTDVANTNSINLFPNPAKNNFTLQFNSPAAETVTVTVVELATGKTIYTQHANIIKGNNWVNIQLNKHYNNGAYVVKIKGNQLNLLTHSQLYN
ncbi:MAG: DUF4114 domain-containing protein, partial [Chitinophagaceae bacterium]